MKRLHIFLLTVAAVTASGSAFATPYYVNNCGHDTNCNGQYAACWSQGVSNCAKKTIQTGMNLGQAGDVVNVAPGTYTGTGNRDLVFPKTGGVARAITVKCAASCPESCIIDAGGTAGCPSGALSQHRGFWFNNDHATNNSVVEAFTIKSGCIRNGTFGGGIFIDHSAPTIRGCTVENNKALYGGGIAMNGCCPKRCTNR